MSDQSTIQEIQPTEQQLDYDRSYVELLNALGIPFIENEFMLHIGEPENVYSWIIHLSIIKSQLKEAIVKICPLLYAERIPFKIPDGSDTARQILDGDFGIENLGKVIVVYPNSPEQALEIVQHLRQITEPYVGPSIYTDAYLGGCVYTRLGAHKKFPLMENGRFKGYHYYDQDSNLIEDLLTIPFTIPTTEIWPFGTYSTKTLPTLPVQKNTIITGELKRDPKGSVWTGLSRTGGILPKQSVIKQGIKHMLSNDDGLDMCDRLRWQYTLQTTYANKLPFPKVYDYLEAPDAHYLVMERIKGDTLLEATRKINRQMNAFPSLPANDKNQLLGIAIKLCIEIDKLHSHQIIHRDITPGNFMLREDGSIAMIDIELAYSEGNRYPRNPFLRGTNGYMSPSQQFCGFPEKEDDYYALTATLINLLLGTHPLSVVDTDYQPNENYISLLCQDVELSNAIIAGLSHAPEKRLSPKQLITVLDKVKAKPGRAVMASPPSYEQVKEIIEMGLLGIINPPTIVADGYWTSTVSYGVADDRPRNQHAIECNFFDGILGILYGISVAEINGIDTSALKLHYKQNFQYAAEFIDQKTDYQSGLHFGSSGLGLSLLSGIQSKHLKFHESTIEFAIKHLTRTSNDLSFGNGDAGQIAVLLHVAKNSDNERIDAALKGATRRYQAQLKNSGKYKTGLLEKGSKHANNFLYDLPGIAFTLWDMYKWSPNNELKELLQEMDRQIQWNSDQLISKKFKDGLSGNFSKGDSDAYTLISLIRYNLKAFECSQHKENLLKAEKLLALFPDNLVSSNYALYSGLAGVGMVFLEAYRLANKIEYRYKVDGIAKLLIAAANKSKNGIAYWRRDCLIPRSPGLMTGTTGVLLFLTAYVNKEKELDLVW